MRILVISDLHIGIKARTKELCPYPEGNIKDNRLVQSFIELLRVYQKDHGAFDYLVIPGDITHQSNLIEYDCGDVFLKKLLPEIGLVEARIIFVPGNHDVDWSVEEGANKSDEEIKLRRKHKYNTLNDNDHIFSRLSGTLSTNKPYIRSWEFDDTVFFGFNSSWHDDKSQRSHFGLIETEQVDQLKDLMEKTSFEDKSRVFVVHHHVYQYTNPHPAWRDTSCMQNSQALLNLLSDYSFDFVIHGHRHVPNFSAISPDGISNINFLCSGSYSCEVPSDIAGSVGNLFHIVEIDERPCKGRVLSFAYDPTMYRWVESRDNHGIQYENPFGNEMPIPTLEAICSTHIDQMLPARQIIPYSELLSNIPDLKYITISKKERLLKNIEKKYGLHRAMKGNEILLIKE